MLNKDANPITKSVKN